MSLFGSGVIGSIIGGATGGGGSSLLGGLGTAALGVASASSLAKQQQSAGRRAYQNRYQWTVADMRAAGINPIAAAGMGLGGGPSAATSAGSANTGQTLLQARRLSAEIGLLEAQTGKAQADTANVNQNVEIAEPLATTMQNAVRPVEEITQNAVDLYDKTTSTARKLTTVPGRIKRLVEMRRWSADQAKLQLQNRGRPGTNKARSRRARRKRSASQRELARQLRNMGN